MYIHVLLIFVLRQKSLILWKYCFPNLQQLRDEIERDFYDGKFSFNDLRVNDAVGLLKQFLREMPTPILTFEYVNAFALVESE